MSKKRKAGISLPVPQKVSAINARFCMANLVF